MSEVLARAACRAEGTARTYEEAIREAGALLVEGGAVEPAYVEAMLERERTMTTFMGNGLAIPHGTLDATDQIRRSAISVVRYAEPLDWKGSPVRVVVGIAGVDGQHLEVLSRIALVFADTEQAQRVADAGTTDELYDLLAGVNA
ncbi:PTS sugar transporter subunit IIA [Cellulomonas oligotrophica]|uniref:Mannitol-specific phosphotransferase enzyme IIA component n=1 Tax=Cellulomonas oligotrophica TaxID=931536 RepID=A0A7Y9JY50_9CELL|nr:PTS sugar transporter subunit IIA [Cellulomonas oligotrophica]NYD85444.1 mannitol/fructose-specific phosphotransferase system IIA component [Cellulomonas oligotrophica]GIG31547.1 hypothetical protein Col01nite_07060 [Cellulomonas oligotrophica]